MRKRFWKCGLALTLAASIFLEAPMAGFWDGGGNISHAASPNEIGVVSDFPEEEAETESAAIEGQMESDSFSDAEDGSAEALFGSISDSDVSGSENVSGDAAAAQDGISATGDSDDSTVSEAEDPAGASDDEYVLDENPIPMKAFVYKTGDPEQDLLTGTTLDLSDSFYFLMETSGITRMGSFSLFPAPNGEIPTAEDRPSAYQRRFPDGVVSLNYSSSDNTGNSTLHGAWFYATKKEEESDETKFMEVEGEKITIPDGRPLQYRQGGYSADALYYPAPGKYRFLVNHNGSYIGYSEVYTITDEKGAASNQGVLDAGLYNVKRSDGTLSKTKDGCTRDSLGYVNRSGEHFWLCFKGLGRTLDVADISEILLASNSSDTYFGSASAIYKAGSSRDNLTYNDPENKLIKSGNDILLNDFTFWYTYSGRTYDSCNLVNGSSYRVMLKDTSGKTWICNDVLYATSSPQITTASLPVGRIGEKYTGTDEKGKAADFMQLMGTPANNGELSWSVSGGELPPGLTLSEDGKISGTITSAAQDSYWFTVTLKETAGDGSYSLEKELVIKVDRSVALEVSGLKAGEYAYVRLENRNGEKIVLSGLTGAEQDGTALTVSDKLFNITNGQDFSLDGAKAYLTRLTALGYKKDAASEITLQDPHSLKTLTLAASPVSDYTLKLVDSETGAQLDSGGFYASLQKDGETLYPNRDGSFRFYDGDASGIVLKSFSGGKAELWKAYRLETLTEGTDLAAEEKNLVLSIPPRKTLTLSGKVISKYTVTENSVNVEKTENVDGAVVSVTQSFQGISGAPYLTLSFTGKADPEGVYSVAGLSEGLKTKITVQAQGYDPYSPAEFTLEAAGSGQDAVSKDFNIGNYKGTRSFRLKVYGISARGKTTVSYTYNASSREASGDESDYAVGDASTTTHTWETTVSYDMPSLLRPSFRCGWRHLEWEHESVQDETGDYELYTIYDVPRSAESLECSGFSNQAQNVSLKTGSGDEEILLYDGELRNSAYGLLEYAGVRNAGATELVILNAERKLVWPIASSATQAVLSAGKYTILLRPSGYAMPYTSDGLDLAAIKEDGRCFIAENTEIKAGKATSLSGELPVRADTPATAVFSAPEQAVDGEMYEISGILTPGGNDIEALRIGCKGLAQVLINGKTHAVSNHYYAWNQWNVELAEPITQPCSIRLKVVMPGTAGAENPMNLMAKEVDSSYYRTIGSSATAIRSTLTLVTPAEISATGLEDAVLSFSGRGRKNTTVIITDNGIQVARAGVNDYGKYSGKLTLSSTAYTHTLTASYENQDAGESVSNTLYCNLGTSALKDITMTYFDGDKNYRGTRRITFVPGEAPQNYVCHGKVNASYTARFANTPEEKYLKEFQFYTEDDWMNYEKPEVEYIPSKDGSGEGAFTNVTSGRVFFKVLTNNGSFILAANPEKTTYDRTSGIATFTTDYFEQEDAFTNAVEVIYEPATREELYPKKDSVTSDYGISTDAGSAWTYNAETGLWDYDEEKDYNFLDYSAASKTNASAGENDETKTYAVWGFEEEKAHAYEAPTDEEQSAQSNYDDLRGTPLSTAEIEGLNSLPDFSFASASANADTASDTSALANVSADASSDASAFFRLSSGDTDKETIKNMIAQRNAALSSQLETAVKVFQADPQMSEIIKDIQVVGASDAAYSDKDDLVYITYVDYASAVNELIMGAMGYKKMEYSFKMADANGEVKSYPTVMYCATTSYKKNGEKIESITAQNAKWDRPYATLQTYIIKNPLLASDNNGAHPFAWMRYQVAVALPEAPNPIYTSGFVCPLVTWTPKPRYRSTPLTASADSALNYSSRMDNSSIYNPDYSKPASERYSVERPTSEYGIYTKIDFSKVTAGTYVSAGMAVVAPFLPSANAMTKSAVKNGIITEKAAESFTVKTVEFATDLNTAGVTNYGPASITSGGTSVAEDQDFLEDSEKYMLMERAHFSSRQQKVSDQIVKKEFNGGSYEEYTQYKKELDDLHDKSDRNTAALTIIEDKLYQIQAVRSYVDVCENQDNRTNKFNEDCMNYGFGCSFLGFTPVTKKAADAASSVANAINIYQCMENDTSQAERKRLTSKTRADIENAKNELAKLDYYDDDENTQGGGGSGGSGGDGGEEEETPGDESFKNLNRQKDDLDKQLKDAQAEKEKAEKEFKDDPEVKNLQSDLLKAQITKNNIEGTGTPDSSIIDVINNRINNLQRQINEKRKKADDAQKKVDDLNRRKKNVEDKIRRKMEKRQRYKEQHGLNKISNNSGRGNDNQDPSGYVYEAVLSNKVPGAAVTLYTSKLNNEAWRPAYDTTQGISIGMTPTNLDGLTIGAKTQPDPEILVPAQNTMVTDDEGFYQWYVPEGLWYVEAEKEGYSNGNSNDDIAATVSGNGTKWLPVLPQQTEVNIPLVDDTAPKVLEATSDLEGVYITFSKYMQEESLGLGKGADLTAFYELLDADDEKVEFTLESLDSEQAPANRRYRESTPPSYTSKIALKFAKPYLLDEG
ncbi:MAG: hypothetical protein IJU50_01070, partial [Lachnospiraceae bacterium]|nr:hypothetical protein [Lachnospiraceae bacterium]